MIRCESEDRIVGKSHILPLIPGGSDGIKRVSKLYREAHRRSAIESHNPIREIPLTLAPCFGSFTYECEP